MAGWSMGMTCIKRLVAQNYVQTSEERVQRLIVLPLGKNAAFAVISETARLAPSQRRFSSVHWRSFQL